MHPRLLWDDIIGATVALMSHVAPTPFPFRLTVENVPRFGTAELQLAIRPWGISAKRVNQLLRTYEASRLVELAAIAIAGLGLYHAGAHEIRDIAIRGTAADYLVDEDNHLLEIAGRTRRSDFGSAWQQKWKRLSASR
jgi:hypothetical protein